MRSIINKYSIIAIAGLVTMTGCSKEFTEKVPYDAITIDAALSTESGLDNALNGVYASLRTANLYGRNFPVTGDLMADNSFVETKNSGRYITQYNYTFIASDGVFTNMWSNSYRAIMRANQIINATTTGANVAKIKAQALAVRALLYFKLVNIYAKPYTEDPSALGVPIVLTYDPYKLPTRNTVAEVYGQIVSDLQAAIAADPDYRGSVYLSKYAIEGLLAKVYLYMGDNPKAKAAAKDVIENGGFTLLSAADFNSYWADPMGETTKGETLFEVDADVVNNNGFDDLGGIYINGYQDIYASSQLTSLYSASDVRLNLFVSGNTKAGPAAMKVKKYSNAQNADRDNPKVMRLSEVYLIAAEASLPANEADALMYLNMLMAQRDPAFVGYASTGTALLADIVQERRKELAFEGDRFYDMNRLKQPITRVQNGGAITAGAGNVNLTIPYPDNRRVGPIPQSEIQANVNIASQQNPGY